MERQAREIVGFVDSHQGVSGIQIKVTDRNEFDRAGKIVRQTPAVECQFTHFVNYGTGIAPQERIEIISRDCNPGFWSRPS